MPSSMFGRQLLLREHGQRGQPRLRGTDLGGLPLARCIRASAPPPSGTSTRTATWTRSSRPRMARSPSTIRARRARLTSRSAAIPSAWRIPSAAAHRGNGPAFADIDARRRPRRLRGTSSTGASASSGTPGARAARLRRETGNPCGLAGSDPPLADIDGDGDLDAFVGTASGTRSSSGTPAPRARRPSPRRRQPLRPRRRRAGTPRPSFADIDGDGDLDAFIGERDGNTFFFQNTGTPRRAGLCGAASIPSASPTSDPSPRPPSPTSTATATSTRSSATPTATRSSSQNTGTANAPRSPRRSRIPSASSTSARASPAFADIDGDGDLDAFVGELYGNDTVLFGNTGSTSAPAFVAAWDHVVG